MHVYLKVSVPDATAATLGAHLTRVGASLTRHGTKTIATSEGRPRKLVVAGEELVRWEFEEPTDDTVIEAEVVEE